MHRLVSYIPAIIVAIIITVISSLYLNARKELDNLNKTVIALRAELEKKNELLLMKSVQNRSERVKEEQLILKDRTGESFSSPAPVIITPIIIPTPEATLDSSSNISVNTKISSIAKFVPLNDEQRARLRNKFMAELNSDQAATENLEDIIGKDNADFYREQRKNTFEKLLQESVEKEILFVSRKLTLDPIQEDNLRRLYMAVEKQIKINRENLQSDQSHKISTLEKLVLEEKERNRLLTEGAKSILSPAQYEQYIQHQSGNQDMQVWHE